MVAYLVTNKTHLKTVIMKLLYRNFEKNIQKINNKLKEY